MTNRVERIEIAGIDCDLVIDEYPMINSIVYRVDFPGGSTPDHKDVRTEDSGTTRRRVIECAEAMMREQYATWEATLV